MVFRSVLKNTIAQGVGKLFTLILSLVTTAILARSLGASGYGAYTFITALVLFFGTISDWGTNIIAVREAAKEKKKQSQIFGSIVLFRLFLAAVSLVLLNLLIRLRPDWQPLVFATTVASLVLIALSFKTSFNVVFQTLLRFEKSALVESLSSALFLIFVFLGLQSGRGLPAVMFGWVLATLGASLLGLFFARRLAKIDWTLNKKIVRSLFWEALPAGALFLVFNLYNRVDTIILEYFRGSFDVGIYGLAYKVHDNLVLGAAFLMNAMFPVLSRAFGKITLQEKLKDYYQKTFDLLLLASFSVGILTFILAPLLIRVLGGEDFSLSVLPLRILVLATMVSYFNHLTGYSLIAFGRQRASLLIAVLALTLNVVANILFVPKYSYLASATITIATEGFVLLLSTLVIWRTVGILPSLFSFPKTILLLFKTKGNIF